jgi:hypothetical protein
MYWWLKAIALQREAIPNKLNALPTYLAGKASDKRRDKPSRKIVTSYFNAKLIALPLKI